MKKTVKLRILVTLASLLFIPASIFANGSSETEKSVSPKQSTERKLIVWQATGCNLEDQIKQWGKENDVDIDLQVIGQHDMMNNLNTVLAAGSGAPDVTTIGGPYIEHFKEHPKYWFNFVDMGVKNIEDEYLPWRLDQLYSRDKSFLIGLPTDIGPTALAYRPDIFAKAGLPTDRDELAKMITSWDDLLTIGKQIKEKTGVPMFNNLDAVMKALLGQNQDYFFDKDNNLILDSSPQVQKAWKYCVKANESGLSANYALWSAEWGAGLTNGAFATQLMPSWMAGMIKTNAPESEGKWDITYLPEGGTNWGGSMIGIPASTQHRELAYQLVTWLLSPEQQLVTFKNGGQFPTTVSNYTNPELINFKNSFFGDAPFGEIYANTAKNIQAYYMGKDYSPVVVGLTDALQRVEDGTQTPDESLENAITKLDRELNR